MNTEIQNSGNIMYNKRFSDEDRELTSSSTIKRMLLITNGHLRPYLSDAMPNSTAPTDRNMSTRVMPQVMSVLERSNSLARDEMVRETVKKSRESQVWMCKSLVH